MMFLLKTDLIIRVLVLQILMIILGQAIILIMQNISEDIIMSIITSIFQAIFQAICRIFPISETAHSAVFHDFSGRFSGACSSLTGVVHIGIAVGIVAASYRLFLKMGYEFFSTGRDIVKKQLRGNAPSQPRHFMYMTLMSFCPMLLWLIPCGRYGLLYNVLRSTQFNKTLLDEGVFLALTGGLLFAGALQIAKANIPRQISEIASVSVGVASVVLIPVSGFSFIGVVFSMLLLFGATKKQSLNYALVMSVPVLVVTGIVEIVVSVTKVGVVPIIIGVILSAVVSYFSVVFLRYMINRGYLKYIAAYDVAMGIIILVVGIFELIFRK